MVMMMMMMMMDDDDDDDDDHLPRLPTTAFYMCFPICPKYSIG